jgi:hypothetical protein
MGKWQVALSVVIFVLLGACGAASASLGGTPVRGDNCTPFNNYSIGAPLPPYQNGAGTIVDQALIL